MLLRYSSLISETIPFHRDYQDTLPQELLGSRGSEVARCDQRARLSETGIRPISNSRSYLLIFCLQTKQPCLDTHFLVQWVAPKSEIKVQYPSNTDWGSAENSGLIDAGPCGSSVSNNGDSQGVSTLNYVLSLDDGRWQRHSKAVASQFISDATEDPFSLSV
ncbi:unnamed protein product [Microthlaspi erraticum]|uniref:Uncharacterized protein n=1 Tax=Microthlaspi erraticum TaxID=1685480 RepID=A0A6D2KY85_9BRAS|nr:unnamed protein product [Microthlaspi erraticum]